MANQSRFAHNSHNTHKGETVMTSFVNSLAMILQEHLLRKVEGTALVRFDGILLLGEGQDFDKRFLCIGTPDECARALATAEHWQSRKAVCSRLLILRGVVSSSLSRSRDRSLRLVLQML